MKDEKEKHPEKENSAPYRIVRSYVGGVSAEEWMVSLMVAHLQAE